MDFCCGGEQSLAEAAAARDFDLQGMIVSLVEMPDAMDDAWFDAETGSLIAHIRARYHDVHLRELPWSIRLAGKVEAMHKDNPAVPRGLTDLLTRISAEIRVHQQREEVILFPMMLRGGGAMIASAIATMRAEHDDHGMALAQIDRLTHDRTAAAGACSTWKALCAGLTKFHDDLTMHVHLEAKLEQLPDRRLIGRQFLAAGDFETVPARRVVAEFPAQRVARRNLLEPEIDPGFRPCQTARPEPVDQHALAVRPRRRVVGALDPRGGDHRAQAGEC